MATTLQKRAVMELVGNGGTLSAAMRVAGYSENTIHTPSKLTDSDGFRELLDLYLPEDKLLKALGDDIDAKPANRKAELELALKVRGLLKDNDSPKTFNIAIFS